MAAVAASVVWAASEFRQQFSGQLKPALLATAEDGTSQSTVYLQHGPFAGVWVRLVAAYNSDGDTGLACSVPLCGLPKRRRVELSTLPSTSWPWVAA